MAAFYWGWTWPTGDRRSYKQLLDFECSTPYLKQIVQAEQHEDDCVVCKEEVDRAEGEVLVWGTVYLPGKDRLDVCLPFHPAHFEAMADHYTHGATRLVNRGSQAGGPPPETPGNKWDSWDSMGITPA